MKSTWPMPAPGVGDPTSPIFHLLTFGVGIGGNTNFSIRVGDNRNFSIFRYMYQHLGIPIFAVEYRLYNILAFSLLSL